MLCSIAIHRIDTAREDVYLASVDDQEAVIAQSDAFQGRTVMRSQLEHGVFWLVDEWTDLDSMQMALAAARTLASVAALVEEPRELLTAGEELARRPSADVDGLEEMAPFFLIAEGWVKLPCLDEYLDTLRHQGQALVDEPGFLRRLLLADREGELHYYVIDQWAGERPAYESYQRRQVSQEEAMLFLSLFAERGKPMMATGVKIPKRTTLEAQRWR